MDPTDKDTKHTKDQSTGTEGYLEYTKEKEKGKVNQLDVHCKNARTPDVCSQNYTQCVGV